MSALFESNGAYLYERMCERDSSSMDLYSVCFTLNKTGLQPVSKFLKQEVRFFIDVKRGLAFTN